MEKAALTAIGAFVRVVAFVAKPFKSRLEKKLWVFRILNRMGLIEKSDQFDYVYLATLVNLIDVSRKPKGIVKLFEIEEVRRAFKEEIYLGNNWAFSVILDGNVHTSPEFKYLKKYDLNLIKEISDFKVEFKNVAQLSRVPKEIERDAVVSLQFDLLQKKIESEFGKISLKNVLPTLGLVPPELANESSPRIKALSNLRTALAAKSMVLIYGSISTGKTQLAARLFRTHNGPKVWTSLKNVSQDVNYSMSILGELALSFQIGEVVGNLGMQIENVFARLQPGTLIVIDDLPLIDGRNRNDDFLVLLISVAIAKGIKILSTSNHKMPRNVTEVLPSDGLEELAVPFFSIEEIREIVVSFGQTEQVALSVSSIILNVSSGHPIIVKAICKYLNAGNWDMDVPKVSQLFSGDYSSELSDETYVKLAKTIDDEKTRELIFRLNLVNGPFSKEEVNTVSEIEPRIMEPFSRVAGVLGLWIQALPDSRYEVSPLIKRLQKYNPDPATKLSVFLALGDQILSKKSLDPVQAQTAIIYFLAANAVNKAGFVLTVVLREAKDNPSVYSDWGFDYLWRRSALPEDMDLQLKLQIRFLQTSLYNSLDEDITYLLEDLENIVEKALQGSENMAVAAIWMSILYSKSNPIKSAHYFKIGHNGLSKTNLLTSLKGTDFDYSPEAMIWLPGTHIKTKNEFEGWLDAFEKLTEKERKQAIVSDGSHLLCSMIFLNMIRAEQAKDVSARNWLQLLSDFEFIGQNAKRLTFPLMYYASIRYRILVLSDSLNKINEAKQLADTNLSGSDLNDESTFLITDMIGRQLFYRGMNDLALAYLARSVNVLSGNFYVEQVEGFLAFSQIVGSKDPETAHVFMTKARDFVRGNEFVSESLRIKVYGEFGISEFLNKNIEKAIYAMEEGFAVVMKSYSTTMEDKVAVIRYGHVVNFFRAILKNIPPPAKDITDEEYVVPTRGFFTRGFDATGMEKFYLPERPFMVSYLFMNCFEEMGDLALAKKWAQSCFSTNKVLTSNAFYSIINTCLWYLIAENKFDEAIRWQIDVVNKMRTSTGDEFNVLMATIDPSKQKSTRPTFHPESYDALLLQNIIVLIVLKATDDIQKFPSSQTRVMDDLIIVLNRWAEVFVDKVAIDAIVRIVSLSRDPRNQDLVEILGVVQINHGSYDSTVKFIGYLMLSIRAPTLEALQQHSALIEWVDEWIQKISYGGYTFIATPFFVEFWKHRFNSRPDDFENHTHLLTIGVPFIQKATKGRKLKNLFKVLYNHLGVDPNTRLLNWMEN
jgi:hypothetical protein